MAQHMVISGDIAVPTDSKSNRRVRRAPDGVGTQGEAVALLPAGVVDEGLH